MEMQPSKRRNAPMAPKREEERELRGTQSTKRTEIAIRNAGPLKNAVDRSREQSRSKCFT